MNNINARMMLALFVVLILGFVGGYAVRGVHKGTAEPSTSFGLNNNSNTDNTGSFHDFWNRGGNALKAPGTAPQLPSAGPSSDGMIPKDLDLSVLVPKVHTLQTDKDVLVTAELPGMSPRSLDIQINNDVLAIKGEKKITNEQSRPYGNLTEQFSEIVKLPCRVDGTKAKTIFRDGTLTIVVPKILPSDHHHRAG